MSRTPYLEDDGELAERDSIAVGTQEPVDALDQPLRNIGLCRVIVVGCNWRERERDELFQFHMDQQWCIVILGPMVSLVPESSSTIGLHKSRSGGNSPTRRESIGLSKQC